MLASLVLLPLAGAFSLALLDSHEWQAARRIALLFAVAEFALSLVLWAGFDGAVAVLQFTADLNVWSTFHVSLGVDGMAVLFIVLTAFTIPVAVLAAWGEAPVVYEPRYFLVLLLVLEALLVAVFAVRDIILFYVFFEAVLIPLFVMVGVWGSGPARVRAAFLLFLYTLLGSLFMLLSFLALYRATGSTDMGVLRSAPLALAEQKLVWLGIFVSLAVKTPLAPFHLWLFRAHAEGNAATSMILAGLILKLAVYGFLRVLIPILPEATAYFLPLVQTVAVVTVLYASLSTIRQQDFKGLIAMSSVAHMAIVVLGIFSNTALGVEGGLLLSLAHGFVSPALFFIVGSVLYARFHTRAITYYRGLVHTMPMMATLFFVFTLANMATPGTANWVGEFQSLAGALQCSPLMAGLAALSIVLSAAYSIWLYNRTTLGAQSPSLGPALDLSRREFMVLLALLVPTVLFGLAPGAILGALHLAAAQVLYVNV
jgi:NADH-ubiquinone oxidoreductase chain 4